MMIHYYYKKQEFKVKIFLKNTILLYFNIIYINHNHKLLTEYLYHNYYRF